MVGMDENSEYCTYIKKNSFNFAPVNCLCSGILTKTMIKNV